MGDDKSDKAGGLFGNPLPIVMVVLLAAGVLVKIVPLESARPTDPERVKFVATTQQDVEARLWQDPFSAVEQHEKNSSQAVTLPENLLMMLFAPSGIKTSDAQHSPDELRKRIQALHKNDDDMTVLAVSVFGGSFGEAAEYRRRSRFAVVSALGFHHYHPEDADAIGYAHIDWPKSNAGKLTVPFEWFERRDKPSKVLVLWLNEDKLTTATPLKDLHQIFNELLPPDLARDLKVKLIGPAGSGMLINLVRESPSQDQPPIAPTSVTIEAFSPGATISNCDLPANTSEESKVQSRWDCFTKPPPLLAIKTLPIVRTTVTDDVLATALMWELSQRNVNRELGYVDPWWERKWPTLKSWFGLGNEELQRKCDDGLVLIGERDTEYGRTLLRYLMDGFSARCRATPNGIYDIPRLNKPPVRIFNYLRGLDGVLPNIDTSGSKASTKDPSAKSKDLLAQLEDAPPEHAEGRNQLDYLRRLATEIDRLDRDKEFFAENGVKAIGIVGSDLYDKLLILQALRNQFKDKIFFTTDLDARYLHADQKDWARNLVVASNFGLALRPALQQSTLPFRDSYQTARYLATLMALEKQDQPFDWTLGIEHRLRPGLQLSRQIPESYLAATRFIYPMALPKDWTDKMEEWLRPQIFEIGRTEAVHLASPSVERLKNWIGKNYSEGRVDPAEETPCDGGWAECKNIEPTRQQGSLLHDHPWAISVMICFGFLLFALATCRVNKTMRAAFDASSPERSAARTTISQVIVAVAVVSMTLAAVRFLMNDSLEQGVGEPFVWLEGISVWPILMLSFVGLVLMVVFACSCYFWIRHQTKHISKDFRLGRPGTQSHTRKWWDSVRTGPYLDLRSFDRRGNAKAKSVDGKKRTEERIDVAALWRNYLRATSFREMAGWIVASLLIGIVLGFAALQALDRPSFPHRGELVKQLHLILVSFNALVLWPIIFWVGYETRACTRFIETLSGARSLWSPVLLDRKETTTGVPRAHLDDYLDFQLIVRATQRIHWLIYLPFVSILFLVLSRSSFFDAMDFPLGLVLVVGLALAYALHSVWLLRSSAKSARATALEHYETRLLTQARSRDTMPLAKVEGAAAGLTRQPISVEQIKILMERIRNNREGAFAPFAQQPALQALLLPFGGYGSVQLIEFLFKL